MVSPACKLQSERTNVYGFADNEMNQEHHNLKSFANELRKSTHMAARTYLR